MLQWSNHAASYTIKVKNYPDPGEGIVIEDDIKNFFEKYGVKGKAKVTVKKVNLVYDMAEYNELKKQKDKLLSKKQNMLRYKHKEGTFLEPEKYEKNEVEI